jgi:hypothetical protein
MSKLNCFLRRFSVVPRALARLSGSRRCESRSGFFFPAAGVNRCQERLPKQWERSGITLTHAVLSRWAALFAECKQAVRQAGDPGRYVPAARPVDRACDRLGKAKDQLAVMIASTDAGGAVVTGSAEQAQFDRALKLVGNALNDFSVAETQANVGEARFGR